MNILFLNTISNFHGNNPSDYLLDGIWHGLFSLDKEKIIKLDSFPEPYWMDVEFKNNKPDLFSQIWGRGFSLYGIEENIKSISQNDMMKNIDARKYHQIIIGVHWSTYLNDALILSILSDISKKYKRNEIKILDGADGNDLRNFWKNFAVYFKREMKDEYSEKGIFPISFSFPLKKFKKDISLEDLNNKKHAFSKMIPCSTRWVGCEHMKTYIYENEEDYYASYQDSFFGYTCKKAGWDCLRHYEIIANNCIPFFTDIEICPKHCLFNFPKNELIMIKKMDGVLPGIIKKNPNSTYIGDLRNIFPGENRGQLDENFNFLEFLNMLNLIKQKFKDRLSTIKVAEYLLNVNS